MLALLSVGIHLSVQQHAQQQAETLIQQWGRDAGVEIGNVRYHMLRNGLVLQDIRVRRGADSLAIRHILVHANPRLLTGEHPRIGDVTVSGAEVTLHLTGADSVWLHEQRLLQLWQATRAFSLRGGRLNVYAQQGGIQPLAFTDLSFDLKTRNAVREFTAAAQLRGGLLQGQWSRTAGQSSAGKASWEQLDATLLTTGLGLNAVSGQLTGALTWTSQIASADQVGSSEIEGQIQLFSTARSVRSHRLQWKGSESAGQWQVDMDADAWPLSPWSGDLPRLAGRKLTAGEFDGTLHWQGKPGAWMINSERGVLYDVTYAAGQLQAWYWSRILYEHALFDTALHHVNIDSAELNDSRLVLDTKSLQADAGVGDHWQINAGQMNINNMTLAVSLPHGRLLLPELNGRSSWPANKLLAFDLITASDATQASEPATVWHLKGSAKRGENTAIESDFTVAGRNIALPTLRALLPFSVDAGHGTSLVGSTDLNVNVSIRQGQWQMQGKASARDIKLSHGDSIWSAADVSTDFGPVGMGLDFQRIKAIEASGWHYVTALKPLSATVPDGPQDSVEAKQLPWWMMALRENNCRIDGLHWQGGRLSVGREDVYWAEDINVDMQGIEPGRWAETRIQGTAGASPFSLDGEWDLFSAYGRMRGTARMDDALPFFLHDWMRASGMPQLIRGRLSAAISLASTPMPDSWLATVTISLKRGLFELQETPSDPMLARTGHKTVELLAGLQNEQMIAGLSYAAEGGWSVLTLESLGQGLQEALRNAMLEHATRGDSRAVAIKPRHLETRVRLRDNKRLSLNERTRLGKVVLKARSNPGMMIDLRPEWAGAMLNAEELERIQQTQQAIERYLTHRNIDSGRIFPLWPTASNHADETGSIWIETVQ